MAAKQELRRGIKSRQLKAGMLFLSFDGSLATPLALGPDRYHVKEIIKVGPAVYTVVFNESYEQDLFPVGIVGAATTGVITATDKDRMTITMSADNDTVNLTIGTFDFRIFH